MPESVAAESMHFSNDIHALVAGELQLCWQAVLKARPMCKGTCNTGI
jgi:hypothetical protein